MWGVSWEGFGGISFTVLSLCSEFVSGMHTHAEGWVPVQLAGPVQTR